MKKIPLSDKLLKFGKIFSDAGFSCYLVGGAVRNYIANLTPSDFDFTTNATPKEVMKIFRTVIPTGIEHGTVTVLFKNESYEVTTFRVEKEYSDSRHPDSVNFTTSLEEDLSRRDFTINSIAANLVDGTIIDPNNGQKDIEKKIIQTVGIAQERFSEDALRILRLFRFKAQLQFDIEKATLLGATNCKEGLKKISHERINIEFIKILKAEKPSTTIKLMQKEGILQLILPELSHCVGIEQNEFHLYDVFDHLIYSCDNVNSSNKIVRVAALFHDIGKPQSKVIKDGKATFYNHEKQSANIADKIMRRLKFPNKEREEVVHLIEQHMFNYTQDWSDKAVRRFLARVKPEYLKNLFELRVADENAHNGEKTSNENLGQLQARIDKVVANNEAFTIKQLAVNGNDLIAVGVEKGPVIGDILEELLQLVMESPELNRKDSLIKKVREIK